MKKLLLGFSLFVSPLVAMDGQDEAGPQKMSGAAFFDIATQPIIESIKKSAPIEALVTIYAKYWPQWEEVSREYCDAPEGRYDDLFQKMADESAALLPASMPKMMKYMRESVVKKLEEKEMGPSKGAIEMMEQGDAEVDKMFQSDEYLAMMRVGLKESLKMRAEQSA